MFSKTPQLLLQVRFSCKEILVIVPNFKWLNTASRAHGLCLSTKRPKFSLGTGYYISSSLELGGNLELTSYQLEILCSPSTDKNQLNN